MSSVFTFDPEPAKAPISPWPPLCQSQHPSDSSYIREVATDDHAPSATHLADLGIDCLEPEPQEGPTEYKLHLLLRPRRSFAALSTVQKVSGSHLSKSHASRSESGSPSPLSKTPTAPASSNQSRQSRLQSLTTQLLWRLQQSSPHHAASRSDLVVPILPEAMDSTHASKAPGNLLPGLGDSQGALYEIGVADDGTLVGLTSDELGESLAVLRAMASSLGCKVMLLRRIIVGDCQWLEESDKPAGTPPKFRKEKLWVAEALISPEILSNAAHRSATPSPAGTNHNLIKSTLSSPSTAQTTKRVADQLRVSLTGCTTSGKSSLLGTLSTSTLDNGRGKSRLSLLKHRHEINSGVTSSVTGSLIGYHDFHHADGQAIPEVQVINYATGNVSSWTDIHSASDPGRLVFLNDSAGHPRFRRTTVRGLVSWAPHWTICCIAADNEADTRGRAGATASAVDILGSACAEIDLAKAHLELCLSLGLPLVVVITKLDLASVSALKPTLGKILSLLKSVGRRPEILACTSDERSFHTQVIDYQNELEVIRLISTMSEAEPGSIVPIVLTSSVTGKGIDKLHALLRHLPILAQSSTSRTCDSPTTLLQAPVTVFHIDEIFAAHNARSSARQGLEASGAESVLSGYLRRGMLSIGQEVIIGPFSSNASEAMPPEVHRANSYPRTKGSPKPTTASRILPRPLSGDFTTTNRTANGSAPAATVWRRVRVCSIRNLRLPVHNLLADQVGTLGLGPSVSNAGTGLGPMTPEDRIRKGMVLMTIPVTSRGSLLPAYSGFVATFSDTGRPTYPPGSSLISYIASIRAPARVLDLRTLPPNATPPWEIFDFEDDAHGDDRRLASGSMAGDVRKFKMTCQFLTSQEWFEVGSNVLVMPASGFGPSNPIYDKGSTGLDGLVGKIIQGVE